jgi:putative ABC transport system ATP-binding protein
MAQRSTTSTPLYQARALSRSFCGGATQVTALDGVSFTINEGEYVAFTGPSGSGKTTLLNILGLLDPDFEGQLQLCGQTVGSLTPRRRAAARLSQVGFVFQQIHLLPALNVLDNVALPLWRLRGDRAEARRRARELLEELGLGHRLKSRPDLLSAGEKQRAALARALINDPAVVLADEPTGNLDAESTRIVLELLARINAQGRTVVVISHDPEVVAAAGRVIRLRYGALDQGALHQGALHQDAQDHRDEQRGRQAERRSVQASISARARRQGRARRPAPCATPKAPGRGGSDRCGHGHLAQAPR